MTRAEYVTNHGVEPHDADAPGRKISTGRKARGYASGTDGRIDHSGKA
jgi:hypothetical protein